MWLRKRTARPVCYEKKGWRDTRTRSHSIRTAARDLRRLADSGLGACVATCKNASAALFTSARASRLALLPQGQVKCSARAPRTLSVGGAPISA